MFYRIREEFIKCALHRNNALFSLVWDITEKLVKCICYLIFFYYQLFNIADVRNLLIFFFVDVYNLFDTYPNFI